MKPEAKHCKYCDEIGHTRFYCPVKPRSVINKRSGKHYNRWKLARKEWFKRNNAENYYCYLCGKYLKPGETTLDHVIPRSKAPELRYDMNNLRPCCWTCNDEKGSQVYTKPINEDQRAT